MVEVHDPGHIDGDALGERPADARGNLVADDAEDSDDAGELTDRRAERRPELHGSATHIRGDRLPEHHAAAVGVEADQLRRCPGSRREQAAVGEEVLELAAGGDRLGVDPERAADALGGVARDMDRVAARRDTGVRLLGDEQVGVAGAIGEDRHRRDRQRNRDRAARLNGRNQRMGPSLLPPGAGRAHQWLSVDEVAAACPRVSASRNSRHSATTPHVLSTRFRMRRCQPVRAVNGRAEAEVGLMVIDGAGHVRH